MRRTPRTSRRGLSFIALRDRCWRLLVPQIARAVYRISQALQEAHGFRAQGALQQQNPAIARWHGALVRLPRQLAGQVLRPAKNGAQVRHNSMPGVWHRGQNMAGRGAGSQPPATKEARPLAAICTMAHVPLLPLALPPAAGPCCCRYYKHSTTQRTHFAGMRSACHDGLAARMQASRPGCSQPSCCHSNRRSCGDSGDLRDANSFCSAYSATEAMRRLGVSTQRPRASTMLWLQQ